MADIIKRLGELKIVPVVVMENANDAEPLGEALLAGGLPCAEVTFRTAAAPEAIRRLAAMKSVTVGAGTVLTEDQAKQAVDAGASFIVTPGFSPTVVRACQEMGVPIAPGVATPTDIQAALEMGLEVLKFFPAEAFGGLKTLKAVSAPYGTVRFIPTGGINAQNLPDYLGFDKVIACGGSWMVKKDLIAAKDWASITSLTTEAVEIAKSCS